MPEQEPAVVGASGQPGWSEEIIVIFICVSLYSLCLDICFVLLLDLTNTMVVQCTCKIYRTLFILWNEIDKICENSTFISILDKFSDAYMHDTFQPGPLVHSLMKSV